MMNKQAILSPESTYHIYNRANGYECLFLSDENYRYFLSKYEKYIHPIADTFCYCLMPNHFHFLIRIKEEQKIENTILKKKKTSKSKTLQGFETLEGLKKQQVISSFLSQQFSHLLNTYTQAFNKQQSRKGSLFMHPFKRKLITDDTYLRKLIHYIHLNPVEAGLAKVPKEWKYSSYTAIVSKEKTKLQREEAIGCFTDIDNFIYCHQQMPSLTGIDEL